MIYSNYQFILKKSIPSCQISFFDKRVYRMSQIGELCSQNCECHPKYSERQTLIRSSDDNTVRVNLLLLQDGKQLCLLGMPEFSV